MPQPHALALPAGFPDAIFEELKNRIVAKMKNPSPELTSVLGGVNGVRFRLRACSDYSDEFIRSLQSFGDAPPIYERYQQERQLFGFFVSGLAALDSFSFWLYFAAAQLQASQFPTNKPGHVKAINPKSIKERFENAFPNEPITTAFINLIAETKLKEWDDFRNILAHRSAPGRAISLGTPNSGWLIDQSKIVKIDANLTPSRLVWLVGVLRDLVNAADQFAQKHF